MAKPTLRSLQLHTWKLGYRTSKVYWEEFQTREEAEGRYQELWWSKVLINPEGDVLRCSSGILDPKGVGVAALLLSARRGFGDVESPLPALDKGDVAFIPADRLPGTSQALQLIWDRVASRSSISWFGSRVSADSLCYFDVEKHPGVRGYVALTIDDAPCRLGPKNSMLPEIRKLLKEHQAQATFLLLGQFVPQYEEELLALLREGHELGNHGLVDKSYGASSPKEFEDAVEECTKRITDLQRRAGIVEQKALRILMCDTYACCPVIQDGDFIGRFLGKQAEHGSIMLIHMPEHGFREWCLLGLQTLLKQLKERNMKVVTAGKLAELAGWSPEVVGRRCKLAL
ncbi:nodB [Symbiodinium sp. CCMP2456]|nr:nodB [Symbiodinium sp. CCMP2456]